MLYRERITYQNSYTFAKHLAFPQCRMALNPLVAFNEDFNINEFCVEYISP